MMLKSKCSFGLLLSLIGIFATCHAASLPVVPGPESRVVGGVDATENQFPHHVSLRYRGSHICGGSIISKDFVLTAAHCVGDFNGYDQFVPDDPSLLEVRVGSVDRLTGGVLVKIAQVIAHENYGNLLNDVAVLRAATPFIFSDSIKPITLASTNTPAGVDVIISGWGLLWHLGDFPRNLQYNTLRSISTAECQQRLGWGSESLLCLLHELDNGACHGDSGGPAVYNNEIVGIAGFVPGGRCAGVYPDGYARVYAHKSWIEKNARLNA